MPEGGSMAADENRDKLPMITREDYQRIAGVLREIGGPNVAWGSQAHLGVWMVERQIRAERLSSPLLTKATWALVMATMVLGLVTVALLVVTLAVAASLRRRVCANWARAEGCSGLVGWGGEVPPCCAVSVAAGMVSASVGRLPVCDCFTTGVIGLSLPCVNDL